MKPRTFTYNSREGIAFSCIVIHPEEDSPILKPSVDRESGQLNLQYKLSN